MARALLAHATHAKVALAASPIVFVVGLVSLVLVTAAGSAKKQAAACGGSTSAADAGVAAASGTLAAALRVRVPFTGEDVTVAPDGTFQAASFQNHTIVSYRVELPPRLYLDAFVAAANHYLDGGDAWATLAAVGWKENDFHDSPPNAAGAEGPMQFMPGTFAGIGVDGNGDGTTDIHNPADAIPSAARLLQTGGAPTAWSQALAAYNAGGAYAHTPFSNLPAETRDYLRLVPIAAAYYQAFARTRPGFFSPTSVPTVGSATPQAGAGCAAPGSLDPTLLAAGNCQATPLGPGWQPTAGHDLALLASAFGPPARTDPAVYLTTVRFLDGQVDVNRVTAACLQAANAAITSAGISYQTGGDLGAYRADDPGGIGDASYHVYGAAIDIDPQRNPQCDGATARVGLSAYCTSPEISRLPYTPIITIMARYGWYWGGNYHSSLKDYMHFEFHGADGPPGVPSFH